MPPPTSAIETVAAAAAAVLPEVNRALEDRGISENRLCGNGALPQFLHQCRCSCELAVSDLSGLLYLRSLHRCHVYGVLKRGVFALRLRKLAFDSVELKSAQFIQDSLCAASLRVNDVSRVLRCLIAISTIFRDHC